MLADAYLPSPRPPHVVPLLQLRGEGSFAMPEVPERAHLLSGSGLGEGGGGTASRAAEGANRAARPRYGVRQAALRIDPAKFPRGALRHSGGHADDRQGSRYSERDAGGSNLGGHRPGDAGFPGGGADVSDP